MLPDGYKQECELILGTHPENVLSEVRAMLDKGEGWHLAGPINSLPTHPGQVAATVVRTVSSA